MLTSKKKYLIWFAVLAVIMACAPALAAPGIPTLDPNAVGTFIVETANAAASQTQAAIPTLTPTVTFTPTPRFTDTPEPTATSTIIFIFPSPTKPVPATSTAGSSNQNFACQILSVSPANGTVMGSRTDFDAKWTVKNVGKKNWDNNSVDYVYLSGDKFHKVSGYNLPKAVKVGETIDLIVDMLAPKSSGTYTTNWTMSSGSNNFCTMSLTIVVR